MSETRKIDDLKLMEEFDFNVPFTVEIFYESDDVETNKTENNEKNQAKELDAILNGIIEDISKVSEKSNPLDHASSKNKKLSESSPAKRAKANNKIDGHEKEVVEQLNVEYRVENIQNNQVVSREEAQQSSINNQALYAAQSSNINRNQANGQCATYNQHNIQSQQSMTHTTWQDSINNSRICSVNNSSENTRQTSESHNNEHTFISSLNSQNSANNNIHPLTSLSQMIISQNQIDLHLKASECVGTLLTTVSSHLVLVMKAWTEYMHVYKSPNKTSYAVEIAYKQYRETKYHFFYLSFASVNNTLLPKENDQVFIKKFIEYTLSIARSRNICVTYQDMRTVVNELFDWVKSQRRPLLNELLRPSAQLHVQGHINNRSKEHQGWQCDSTNSSAGNVIFRSELHGRDSAINVNSSAIGTNQPIQNVNTHVQSYETLVQHWRLEPQNLSNHPSYVEEFQTFTRQDNQGLTGGASEDPKNKKKRGPRQKKNHPVVSVLEVQARTLPPPPYDDRISAQRNCSDNHLKSSANYDSFQPQYQACEVNRSLSRDSGIVSPRSPANDLNYSSVVMTPFITHVTSLNPSATQIKDGVCLVCGTTTKQMCRGCYKAYYCSNQCQANFSLDDTRRVLQMKHFIDSHGEVVPRFEQYKYIKP